MLINEELSANESFRIYMELSKETISELRLKRKALKLIAEKAKWLKVYFLSVLTFNSNIHAQWENAILEKVTQNNIQDIVTSKQSFAIDKFDNIHLTVLFFFEDCRYTIV